MTRLSGATKTAAVTAYAVLVVAGGASSAPSAMPSMTIAPAVVEYGKGEVELRGVVPSRRAGETVSILSQPCRFTELAEIGAVKTAAGGAYRFRVQPMLNTTFRVRWNDSASRAAKVSVRPIVTLKRVRAGRYRVEVATTNPVFLDGKHVVLQRAVGDGWATVKQARLTKASDETAITVLSATTIAARVKGSVRAVLPQSQAHCYLGATSPTIAA